MSAHLNHSHRFTRYVGVLAGALILALACTPSSRSQSTGGSPQAQPAGQATSAPTARPADEPQVIPENLKIETEADRDKLAKMIMDAVLAQQKARGEEPGTPPATQPAVRPPKPMRPNPAQATPTPTAGGVAATQPADHGKAGCGSSGGQTVDLTPPAPDQPQPKFVVNQMKCEAKPVWRGTPLEFSFEVTNAGEAPLAVRMKGG